MRKFSFTQSAAVLGLAATVYAGSALAETQVEKQEQGIQTAVKQYLTDAGKLNLQDLKKHLDWPMTLVATSPTLPDSASTIRNETEFDAIFSKSYKFDESKNSSPYLAELASSMSDVKVQIVNDELATVTYKCLVGKIEQEKKVIPAHTLDMLTVLRKRPTENEWKVSYSTFPM